jgi:hypothetical protein
MLQQLGLALDQAWPSALARWSSFVMLRRPVISEDQEAIAQIDLRTRQVSINGHQVLATGLVPHLEPMLAHEVGHHFRFPASLVTEARLQLMGRAIIPDLPPAIGNVFTDLLINQHLGPAGLVEIYRALSQPHGPRSAPPSAVFSLYLATYERLWSLPAGSLLGDGIKALRYHRGYEEDARRLAVDLFLLPPNLFERWAYFLAVIRPYLEADRREHRKQSSRACGGNGQPSSEDWAEAIEPNDEVRRAVERARGAGWIDPQGTQRAQQRAHGQIGNLPPDVDRDQVMAAHYRRLAERYLIRPPAQPSLGDGLVPSTLEDWEPGDPVRSIDWLASVRARGSELGGIAPLKRTQLAELEGVDLPAERTRVEIYLDVSGSMPRPVNSLNAMTLAALILAQGAIRSGGQVRACLYSNEYVTSWSWTSSERAISRFLMGYIGGGTEFPFALLAHSLAQDHAEPPLRIAITDYDFAGNVAPPEHRATLRLAAERRPPILLLLHDPSRSLAKELAPLGARIVTVEDLDNFPQLASSLARALFERPERRG